MVPGHALTRDPGCGLQEGFGARSSREIKTTRAAAESIADELHGQPSALRLQKWSEAQLLFDAQ